MKEFKRVALVTGASGMLGSHLVLKLKSKGWKVYAIVRRGFEAKRPWSVEVLRGIDKVYSDLTTYSSVEEAVKKLPEIEEYTLYHLAGLLYGRFRELWSVNYESTLNLLRALLKHCRKPKKVVYISSLSVIGDNLPVYAGEDAPPKPKTTYEVSKYYSEKLLEKLSRKYNFKLVIFRPLWIYGEYSRNPDLTLITLACKMHFKIKLSKLVRVYMVDAKVFAEILEEAGRVERVEGVYNVAEPTPYSLEEVFNTVSDTLKTRTLQILIPNSILKIAPSNVELLRYLSIAPKSLPLDKLLKTFKKPREPLMHSRLKEVVEWMFRFGILSSRVETLKFMFKEFSSFLKS